MEQDQNNIFVAIAIFNDMLVGTFNDEDEIEVAKAKLVEQYGDRIVFDNTNWASTTEQPSLEERLASRKQLVENMSQEDINSCFVKSVKINSELITTEEIPMSETEQKTRYTVGETVYGINFAFENCENIMFRLPYLYDMREVTAINIIPLLVKEHHKVLNDWAEDGSEPDCDGFILTDAKEQVWHNQYPRASYGQLSDEGDRRFSRKLEDQVIDDMIKAGEVLQTHLLTDVIGNIRRAIKHFETPEIKADLEKGPEFSELKQRYDLLVKLNGDITKKFNEDFKKDFKELPIWEAHPDITHFVVVDLES